MANDYCSLELVVVVMHERFVFVISLLTPGLRASGNKINVYLQPLIDELIDL